MAAKLIAILLLCIILPQLSSSQIRQIKGYTYLDKNSSGILDSADILQPAIRIYLYEDINSDGLLDGGDVLADSFFTDAGGEFLFTVNTLTEESRVSTNNDDAEERVSNGYMNRASTDLELIADASNDQIVGMRFRSIDIPQGATIINAYVEFQCDEANTGATNLNIFGHDHNNAPYFSSSSYNISNRTRTDTSIAWNNIVPWTVNVNYQTSDIGPVIQEIVDRSGWVSGNKIVIMIDGSGERTAESYNGENGNAPLLSINYTMGGGDDFIVSANTNDYSSGYVATTSTEIAVSLAGGVTIDSSAFFGYFGESVGCFAADDVDDALWIINRFSGYNEKIGPMGVNDVEAIAADLAGLTLYGTDDGQLGILNRYDGTFTAFSSPVGSGDGIDGTEDFTDIDGLVFDPSISALWGTHRRTSDYDVLIQIDTSTGQVIPDAFGAGIDYVEISGTGFLLDIDDLAIDPSTGQLYGINNNGGVDDYLVTIDKTTGAGNQISLIGVDDVEGLGITNEGLFYATTGQVSGTNSNKFFQIDRNTGSPTLVAPFDDGGDYEGCDCILGPVNSIVLSEDLMTFSANLINRYNVELEFSFDNGTEHDYYEIQRNIYGKKFETLIKIDAENRKNYSHRDYITAPGVYYYRIKTVSVNGGAKYSWIKAVEVKDEKLQSVNIYPNPSAGKVITVAMTGNKDEVLDLQIMDANGNNVQNNENFEIDGHQFNFQFSQPLSPGIYILKIYSDTTNLQKKFVVN